MPTTDKTLFPNQNWLNNHLKQIQKKVGARYTPELNIELPIGEIFDGIGRTQTFYSPIRAHFGKLTRAFRRITSKYGEDKLGKSYETLKNELTLLFNLLSELKEFDTCTIHWEDIKSHTKKSQELSWNLIDEIRKINEKEKKKEKNNDKKQSDYNHHSEKYNSDIHYSYELQKELLFFEELATSSKAKLSNDPFLLLTGSAGTGKTHLLCDIAKIRINNESTPYPTILLFGEDFQTGRDVWEQIIDQLGIGEIRDKSELLTLLDKAGQESQVRALIIIDALNETSQNDFWKENLDTVIEDVKKYSHIGLGISIRSGFENEVLTEQQRDFFIHEEHHGFLYREWEAVTRFFENFSLPLPEVPLLLPEFQNPLFLLLFCKAFSKRFKQNRKKLPKKAKQVFRGHEGATYIFENFVKNTADKIAKDFGLPVGRDKKGDYVIWDTVIEKIAEKMVAVNSDKISEEDLKDIVTNKYPSLNCDGFIKSLERNLLITKVPRYSKESTVSEFDFRFPFQKFSDHLIARYLFKRYYKNRETPEEFFAENSSIGKLLSNPWNIGIIEALSIQVPERFKGKELAEIAPYLQDSYVVQDAFVESLIWRKPTAFTNDLCNTLKYINEKIIQTEHGHHQLLNAFLSVAPIPEHSFNAYFFHQYLSKFSMPERDAWWSTFLHHQHGEKGAVDRLIHGMWSDQDKSHISDDSILLTATALSWFLTTPNRFLRDKSTKALVRLLTDRIHFIQELLKKFKDVNDPYISERLYAVAYGCVLRNQGDTENLKNLALWIYENIFKDGKPPVHILLRDYARGVIETALNRGIKFDIDVNKIKPPYQSEWPDNIPSEKELKDKYYPKDVSKDRGHADIWYSLMYNYGGFPADFGNYVVNSHLGPWRGKKIGEDAIDREELFEEFKNEFSPRQKNLWDGKSPFIYENEKKKKNTKNSDMVISFQIIKGRKSESEIKAATKEFKGSLSEEQKELYEKDIEPFLDHNNKIFNSAKDFDTGFAQRWIFNRVIELGWDPELHGEFDRFVNYNRVDRREHKSERIGKKYQWIAYHEFLAMVSDNFEFKGDSGSDSLEEYKGPWNPYVRDIDPSFVLQSDSHINKIATFRNWKKSSASYDAWEKRLTDLKWLQKTDDLQYPEGMIQITDDNRKEWLLLEGFIKWEEKTPPEEEKYNLPTRELWYMIKSYIVKKKDLKKIFEWAKKQNFMGRWMPESHEIYECFLGEYPNSTAFEDLRGNYNIWTPDARSSNDLPVPLVVTDDSYLNEFTLDCSHEGSISIKLPCKWLVNEMDLEHTHLDGRFFGKDGELIAFVTTIFNEDILSGLLINREKFCEFLNQKGYAIFWTLLGEKQMIGGKYTVNDWIGKLELSGAYTLNSKNKIVGEMQNKFKK